MATLAENIESMAEMVTKLKKNYRLSEGTILHLIDMNLAIAQNNGFGGVTPDEEGIPMPDNDADLAAALGIHALPEVDTTTESDDAAAETTPEVEV